MLRGETLDIVGSDPYWKFRAHNLPQTSLSSYIPVDGVEVKFLDGCNRACTFCVNEDYIGKPLNQIDASLFLRSLLDWITDPSEIEKPVALYGTGGEPMIVLDLVEQIVKPVAERGIVTRLVTNGTLLDDGRVGRLVAMGLSGIKVTYTTAQSGRLSALVKGSHREDPERLLAGIRRAKAAGLWVFVRIGLGRVNYDEVTQIYRLMCDLGVDVVQIKPWISSGLAAVKSDDLCLTPSELVAVLASVADELGPVALQGSRPELTVSCFPPARQLGFTVKDCANIAKIYCEPSGQALICNFAEEYLGTWHPDRGGLLACVRERRNLYAGIVDSHGVASCPSRLNWSHPTPVVKGVPAAWKRRDEAVGGD